MSQLSCDHVHEIKYTYDGGWEVYSPALQFAVRCGGPSDAKRVAQAIECKYPHLDGFDYMEVDAAIAKERALRVLESRHRVH